MKYYKDPETGNVIAYENEGERSDWGAPRLVEMSPDEIEEHLNPAESLEDFAARKLSEINTARDAAFASGLSYNIAGETDVVQTRPQDQINLLGLNAKAQLLIADSVTAPIMPFRGLSNVTRRLTPQAMSELALAALAHIEDVYQQSWERKDAIAAILTDESISNDAKREGLENITWQLSSE